MRGAGSSQVSWVKDSFESSGILSARSRLFHCIKIRIRKTPETQRFRGFWRRSRDLNPGCDYSHYSLSRGAPSATWVLPQAGDKAGGESGIRTHGCFHIAGFQDRCFRPLSHLSVRKSKPLPEADMILSSPEPFVNTKYTLPVKKRGRSHAAAPSRHRQSGVTTPDSSPSPC